MFYFFKKRISVDEAVEIYFRAMTENFNEAWNENIQAINELIPNKADTEDGELFRDFIVAVIALETRAVLNIYQSKYHLIMKSMFELLRSFDGFGEDAVNSIQSEFLPSMRDAENKGHLFTDGIAYVLSKKLRIPVSPVYSIAILSIIIPSSRTWKTIFEKYRIK